MKTNEYSQSSSRNNYRPKVKINQFPDLHLRQMLRYDQNCQSVLANDPLGRFYDKQPRRSHNPLPTVESLGPRIVWTSGSPITWPAQRVISLKKIDSVDCNLSIRIKFKVRKLIYPHLIICRAHSTKYSSPKHYFEDVLLEFLYLIVDHIFKDIVFKLSKDLYTRML